MFLSPVGMYTRLVCAEKSPAPASSTLTSSASEQLCMTMRSSWKPSPRLPITSRERFSFALALTAAPLIAQTAAA